MVQSMPPTCSASPARREAFFPYLEAIRDHYEIPILYVSHQLDEGIRLADNAILLEDGKVKVSGPIHEIFISEDLRRFAGEADAGAIIEGTIKVIKEGLAHIEAGAVTFISHDRRVRPGDKVRLRIKGRDVALALTKPEATSVLNVLPATIQKLDSVGETEMDVTLTLADGAHIFARITKDSATRLKLERGLQLYAMIKAVAVARS